MLTQQIPARTPAIQRSRLMLEAVSELVGANEWRDKQVMIYMRPQGDAKWRTKFYASDGPDSIDMVVSGEADIAICNPGGVLGMAFKGKGPFKKPLPLRSIMVMPQFDQLGFAVHPKTGLKTLGDLKRQKYPLRVSLRGQPDHSVHFVVNHVLSAFDMTLDDIKSWGGKVVYTEGMPNGPDRLGAVERGELDAVWDEALPRFAKEAIQLGMKFLPVDEPELKKLESDGLMRAAITDAEYPGIGPDVWTVDFSGWPVFCLASASDDMVYKFCEAVDARRALIPWEESQGKPLPVEQLCKDSKEGPLYLPLHPAAERYWRDRGYLK